MSVVCKKDIIKPDGIHGAPDLAAEILSPSTVKRDKGIKKVESRSIEVYLLNENKFVLDEVYHHYRDYELEYIDEEDKGEIKYEFSPSMFPDLTIKIEDVFRNIF